MRIFARSISSHAVWQPYAQRSPLLAPIVGEPSALNPDDSEGVYSHDFTSFLFLENALDYLESAVESADAAPTPDMYLGYARLAAIYQRTLARLDAIGK
jgi:hypothetical protein